MDKIRLTVVSIASSSTTLGNSVVVLKEIRGRRTLPILIGQSEGQSINIALENIPVNRPLTHDLFLSLAKHIGFYIEEVVIQDFRDGTFVANIVVSDGEKNYSIDSRPSDAIALALRFNAPIFATEQVMNDTSVVVGINEEEDDEDEQEEDPKKGLLSMLIPSTTTGTGDNAQSDFQRMLKASTKDRLQELLDEALANENYERAAAIRDELNKR